MEKEMSSERKMLRQGFKYVNRFMVTLFRLGLGDWLNSTPSMGGRIMVLTHTGRKSGERHRTPVNYAIVNGELYCLAGFGPSADWYRNIKKNPQVEVWLPEGWWCGAAEDVSDSPYRVSLIRAVIIASGFAGRVAGLDPVNMSDSQLEAATRDYPLIHVKRTEARTGAGGPADLAWVWPFATFLLLSMLFTRKKK